MRTALNDGWIFSKNKDFSQSEAVRIPHTNALIPISYFDEKDYQFISFYKKEIEITGEMLNKSLLLTFEGAAHMSSLYVNGELALTHNCGYTAFSADISPFVREGKNTIFLEVDSRESLDIPPFGYVVDYLTYGGIYREVYLDIVNKAHIEDIFVNGSGDGNMCAQITLSQNLKGKIVLNLTSFQSGKAVFEKVFDIDAKELTVKEEIKEALLWDLDNPNLYVLSVKLEAGGEIIDEKSARFGFRSAEFKKEGFYLNGKKITLRGLNRHQNYAYAGYAMPSRPQRLDAEILKKKLAVNIVRTSHYPQSRHFLEACDELGLLVFTEIPGWQHIGGEQWQKQALENTQDMVKQYRNYPCIVCWGVRINESDDCDTLYEQTNAAAKSLDGTRATAGVRFIANSNLLEDIYSYNDFNFMGDNIPITPKNKMYRGKKPMLITEFNGHMYPTKSYDDEAHRLELALRHLKVMEGYYSKKHLLGGLGWCMFDYNTHCQFGSGDKICHHGVLDMFRNEKLAAAAYSMQGSEPFMEISSSMDKGDWASGVIGRVYAFTNADSVKLYKSGKFVKEFFPDRKSFPNIPHAPVVIDDFVGDALVTDEGFSEISAIRTKQCLKYIFEHGYSDLPLRILLKALLVVLKEKITIAEFTQIGVKYVAGWGSGTADFVFEGIFGGKVLKSAKKASGNEISLFCRADTTQLKEGDTYDVATVSLKALDEYGNLCVYCNEPVLLKAQGAVEIIGESAITLRGGAWGVYVKSKEKGCGSLTLSFRGKEQKITFSVS